jgi:hypothetical protein
VGRAVCWLVAVLLCLRAPLRTSGCVSLAAAHDAPTAEAGEGEEPAAAIAPEQEPDYLALADAPVFLPRSYLYWGTPAGPPSERAPLVFALSYALQPAVRSRQFKGPVR